MTQDAGALLKLADALESANWSGVSIGNKVMLTGAINALRQAASQGSAGGERSAVQTIELARKAALFREGARRIYEGQGDRADMWFFDLWHFLGDAQEALTQSAPERLTPQNAAERLPSSDAAISGAGTAAQAAPHHIIKDISDDKLFNIATEAWSTQTDYSWSTDGLEAAVLAVRSAVEEAPALPSAQSGGAT